MEVFPGKEWWGLVRLRAQKEELRVAPSARKNTHTMFCF